MTLSPAARAAEAYPWARVVAGRAVSPFVPAHIAEDLVGDGLLGLVQAARSFVAQGDAEVDAIRFRAYATRRIRGAVLDAEREADPLTRTERAAARRGEIASPPPPASLDDMGDHSTVADTARAPLTTEQRGRLARTYAAMGALTFRQRAALILTVRDGYTLREAGAVLGISESGVCRSRAAALARLRRSLGATASV